MPSALQALDSIPICIRTQLEFPVTLPQMGVFPEHGWEEFQRHPPPEWLRLRFIENLIFLGVFLSVEFA